MRKPEAPLMDGEMISCRFPDELAKWLRAEALRRDRSVSWLVRRIVRVAKDKKLQID